MSKNANTKKEVVFSAEPPVYTGPPTLVPYFPPILVGPSVDNQEFLAYFPISTRGIYSMLPESMITQAKPVPVYNSKGEWYINFYNSSEEHIAHCLVHIGEWTEAPEVSVVEDSSTHMLMICVRWHVFPDEDSHWDDVQFYLLDKVVERMKGREEDDTSAVASEVQTAEEAAVKDLDRKKRKREAKSEEPPNTETRKLEVRADVGSLLMNASLQDIELFLIKALPEATEALIAAAAGNVPFRVSPSASPERIVED